MTRIFAAAHAAFRLATIAGLSGLVLAPAAALADDYQGTLKLPGSVLRDSLYTFSTVPAITPSPAFVADNTYRLKLGYKYSRYLAVEGEFNDFARSPDPFSSPASLSSSFRSTGFGVDTVATLPLWGMSFYGRMGAYRGDSRTGFGAYSTSLLGDNAARGTRWRYGLGMRYDLTKSLGVRAEVERYSPLGASLASETDADQVSIGVSWRF